jgi:hypothetical protein
LPGTTSRLSLPYPVGTDLVSVYPTASASQMATLDNAVLFTQGVISAIPAAGTAGRVYYGTDVKQFFQDTGSAWQTLSPATATACQAVRESSFTATTGSPNRVPLDTILIDQGGNFNTTIHNYTVPSTGIYEITSLVAVVSSAANQFLSSYIYQNGVGVVGAASWYSTAAFEVIGCHQPPTLLSCTVGDTLALWAEASAGSLSSIGQTPYINIKQVA